MYIIDYNISIKVDINILIRFTLNTDKQWLTKVEFCPTCYVSVRDL